MSMRIAIIALMIAAGGALVYLGVAGDTLTPPVRAAIRFGAAASWFLFAWYIWRSRIDRA